MRDEASSTARVIALAMVLAHDVPRLAPHLRPGAVELSRACLLAAGAAGPLALLARRPGRALALLLERLTHPGILLHFLLRKRWLEERARAALAEGATQVVVVGAGYDALAFRLHREHPGVAFVEVDHPATQAAKRTALARLGAGPNLHLLGADLARAPLADVLRGSASFRAGLPTLFVAEGLLMYLVERDVLALLGAVPSLGTAGSSIVFSFFEPRADGRPGFRTDSRLVDLWLRRRGERYASAIAREQLPALLARAGLALVEATAPGDLRRLYLAPADDLPLLEGELLARARAQ